MFRLWTFRGLSISFMILIGVTSNRLRAMDDPWPLVNAADRAVWGTLLHSSSGTHSRLLVIQPLEPGVAPIRVLDPILGLPEGTEVFPRQRGLFLISDAVPENAEFLALEGTILVGGFLAGSPTPEVRSALERLTASPEWITSEEVEPFTDADARTLLSSEWSTAREIALGWWAFQGESSPASRTALDASLATDDPRWLQKALAVYLHKGWTVPDGGLAELIAKESDPVLCLLATEVLRQQSSPQAEAALILAWSDADRYGRQRLLHAYADLGLEESLPWWESALGSDDPLLWKTAVTELARSKVPGAVAAYAPILESKDLEVLRLAIEGLALARTAEAAQLLENFRERTADDHPLAPRVERALSQPGRVIRGTPRALEKSGR